MSGGVQQIVSVALPIIANIAAPGIGGMIASSAMTMINGGTPADAFKAGAMSWAGGQVTGGGYGGEGAGGWGEAAGGIPVEEGGMGLGEVSASQGYGAGAGAQYGYDQNGNISSVPQNDEFGGAAYRYDDSGNIIANPRAQTQGNIEMGDLAKRAAQTNVAPESMIPGMSKNTLGNIVNVGKGIYGIQQANKQAGMAQDLYNAQLKQMQQSNSFASYRPEALAQLRAIQNNPQAYLDSPEVKAMREAGLEAARRQGAAGGNLSSGKGAIDLQDWGQKFAFETLQNKQNQLANQAGVNDFGGQFNATTQSGLAQLARNRQQADYAGGDLVGTGMNILQNGIDSGPDDWKKKKQQEQNQGAF